MSGFRLFPRRRRPPDRSSNTNSAIILLTLTALRESSDACTPLKSAVSGVLHIWELSQKVKRNKDDCQNLASRVQDILDKIAAAVPDVTRLSPDLLDRINDFMSTLDDIETFMKGPCCEPYLKRLLHHREHEDSLSEFNRRLDDLLKSVTLISAIKVELLAEDQRARLEASSVEAEHRHQEILMLIHQRNCSLQKLATLGFIILFDYPSEVRPAECSSFPRPIRRASSLGSWAQM